MQRFFSVCLGLLVSFASQAQAQVVLGPPILIEAPRATIVSVTPLYPRPTVWVQRSVDGVDRWVRLGSSMRVLAHEEPEHWVHQDRDHLVRVPARFVPEVIREEWLEIGEPIALQGRVSGTVPQRHSTINRAEQEREVRVTTIYVDAGSETLVPVPKKTEPPKAVPVDDGWRPRTGQQTPEPAITPEPDDQRVEPVAPPREKKRRDEEYFDPAFLVRNR